MYSENLKRWENIPELSLAQAASLIAGIDPSNEDSIKTNQGRVIEYERAIADAVQRADELAWHDARELDELCLSSEENPEALRMHQLQVDIWEVTENFQNYLPSMEIRQSVGAVHADPVSVPILLPVDPWYTATVSADDMNDWIQRNNIESAYLFSDWQKVIVTTRENNWDALDESSGEKRSSGEIFLSEQLKISQMSTIQYTGLSKWMLESALSTIERLKYIFDGWVDGKEENLGSFEEEIISKVVSYENGKQTADPKLLEPFDRIANDMKLSLDLDLDKSREYLLGTMRFSAGCAEHGAAMVRNEDLASACTYIATAMLWAGMLEGRDWGMYQEEKWSGIERSEKLLSGRHHENRACREQAMLWYDQHRSEFRSEDEIAEAIAGKIVPMKFRAVRAWITEHRKNAK
jgi:hypothetical protein